MIEKFKNWWKWNPEFEKNSADNPVTALSEQQRRNAGPLLALALLRLQVFFYILLLV